MNAILLFPNEPRSSGSWSPGTDTCMLPVIDRPILQHVMDSLADYGVKQLHAVLPYYDGRRERFLGGGSRWGMKIFYWYGDKPTEDMFFEDPLSEKGKTDRYVVAWADCLPQLSELPTDGASYMVALERSTRNRNWLFLSATDAVRFVRKQVINYESTLAATCYLDSSTPARLLESEALVLTKQFPLTQTFAREFSLESGWEVMPSSTPRLP